MPRFDKKYDQVLSHASATTAFRKIWNQRFAALSHYLKKLQAERIPAVETVHQLRVWARRTTAVVDLFAPTPLTGAWLKLRQSLKKIRRWAGEVRDFDVIWSSIKQLDPPLDKEFLSLWKRRRRIARRALAARARTKPLLKEGPQTLKKLFRQVESDYKQSENLSFESLVRKNLRTTIRNWSQQARKNINDPLELHELRIAGKRVRYLLEITSTVLPRKLCDQIYAKCTQLHEELGAICDKRATVERYTAWREEAPEPTRKTLSELLRRHRRQLNQHTKKFVAHWTPATIRAWEQSFTTLAGGKLAVGKQRKK